MERSNLPGASRLLAADPALPAVRILTNGVSLSASEEEVVRGRAILIILSQSGHCVQEVLKPAQQLKAAGCQVVFASLDGGDVDFDPLCNMLAQLERAWDPSARLLREAKRQGLLCGLPSLRALAGREELERWQNRFDAVVVPGGHGEIFAAFVRDPLVVRIVEQFLDSGRVTALMCHAAIITAMLESRGTSGARGRTVTCWPRAYERIQKCLPFVGRYLAPFGRSVGCHLEQRGNTVLDSVLTSHRVHAVIDGNLVTGRGPWSTDAFAIGVVQVLSKMPRRTAAASEALRFSSPA